MLLGVDVGGTFTDAVLVEMRPGHPSATHTAKVPSTPGEQATGVMAAVRAVLAQAGADPGEVERFAHGMTVATNALLEGRTARTALLATEGFTDVVALGRQARAHLYRLCEDRPPPLAPPQLRFGVPERMTPEGPLRTLDPEAAEALADEVAACGAEAVAVVLLHSYAHPEHERTIGAALAERAPAVHVSLSHEVVGTFREYERAATTEVDAAVSPLVGSYLRRLGEQADATGLVRPAVMQSSGGLIDADGAAAHAALTVLSGPAGGVRGALAVAAAAGERDVVCFDMGGTSCDVCVIEGARVRETAEGSVAGRPLALATLDIHTVGAGGGSIAWRDPGGALRVGPRSAGADPGPACYGRGGRLPTVTDANLLLGRLPAGTPLAGGLRLDRDAAERAVAGLARELGLTVAGPDGSPAPGPTDLPKRIASGPGGVPGRPAPDPGTAPEQAGASAARCAEGIRRCAEGIVRVAEAEMARALRTMTVERGVDPRGFALMPFGGAGPLHAAALAREMRMRRVVCPRASGVLCALGLAAAPPRRDAARTVMLAGATFTAERVRAARAALLERACTDLGVQAERVTVRHELRYRGQSFELAVDEQDLRAPDEARAGAPGPARASRSGPDDGLGRAGPAPDPDALREAFAAEHERRYGYRDEEGEVELVTIRASAWGAARTLTFEASGAPPAGTRIEGPAVVPLPESTLYVPAGWSGEVDAHGTVHLHDTGAP